MEQGQVWQRQCSLHGGQAECKVSGTCKRAAGDGGWGRGERTGTESERTVTRRHGRDLSSQGESETEERVLREHSRKRHPLGRSANSMDNQQPLCY